MQTTIAKSGLQCQLYFSRTLSARDESPGERLLLWQTFGVGAASPLEKRQRSNLQSLPKIQERAFTPTCVAILCCSNFNYII